MRPFPIKNPITKIVMQFIGIKINPETMGADNRTTDSSFPVLVSKLRNPNPNPSKILNTGPAKQAVIAMVGMR